MLPGQDLMALTKSHKDGGIVHAIQPIIVPEIIARCGMRWWNASSASLAGSVVRNAVIKRNLGHFGELFDEMYSVNQASLKSVLRELRKGHQHCARIHHLRLARLIASLFEQTSEDRINYVKDKVFGVRGGAPILEHDHPVIQHLTRGV